MTRARSGSSVLTRRDYRVDRIRRLTTGSWFEIALEPPIVLLHTSALPPIGWSLKAHGRQPQAGGKG